MTAKGYIQGMAIFPRKSDSLGMRRLKPQWSGTMSLIEEKAEIRKRGKALLKAVGQEEAERLSRRAADNLRALPEYKEARLILAFLSMGEEIRTESLIESAMKEGKIVAVPRMEYSPEGAPIIVFVHLPKEYHSWPRDRFGIPLPPAESRPLSEEELCSGSAIVVTPGLAFDREGGRLGRGKGYYDRFLSGARACAARRGASLLACGFCYAAQLVDEVPAGRDDVAVDLVVTEEGRIDRPRDS